MNTSNVAAVALAFVPWLTSDLASAQEDRLLYTRADIESSVTGEISFGRAYTRQIELPREGCEGGPFTCTADRTYGQAYVLSFVEETMTRGADGKPSLDRRDRGRLAIAVDLPKKGENDFEDALLAHVQGLSVAEFARPQAGMTFLEEPLGLETLQRSKAPAWVCAELEGSYRYDLVVGDARTYANAGDLAREACRAIEEAVRDDVNATRLRTLPDIRAELRQEVSLATSSTLAGMTWANRLVSIPHGVTFRKTALEGNEKTGATRDIRDGAFVGHEGRYGAVEQYAVIPRASLDLAEAPMRILRWTFATTREQYGRDPKTEHEANVSLLVAVAPVADPLMTDLDRAKTELSVPEGPLVEAALLRFAQSAALAHRWSSERSTIRRSGRSAEAGSS